MCVCVGEIISLPWFSKELKNNLSKNNCLRGVILIFLVRESIFVGWGSPFPIVLVSRYKLSLCHTPIKPDLLGFPGIGVFVCGLRDHVITRFASNLLCKLLTSLTNFGVGKSWMALKLSSTQQHVLAQDVTREEIKHAIFSLKNNKAPGLDGFNVGFFKRMWHIVGEDVINVVCSFFQTRRMLKEMNATSIFLIPKVANPMRLIDFRPISCCNTVYKCIAKILAERIKAVLPSLVGPYQTTFISG